MNGHNQKWLIRLSSPVNARLRLVCFPHAGAGASVFRNWPARLPADIELWAIQPAGREGRFLEPLLHQMPPLTGCVTAELLQLPEMPLAFFGHSMGALLAFETARLLRVNRRSPPACLFVSGNRAPQLQKEAPKTYNLPEKEFLEALRRMNGIPPEILNNSEWRELLIPILRADLSVCQTYRYISAEPLVCPIVVFGGQEDAEAPRESLAAWGQQTSSAFRVVLFPGGHFYLQTSEAQFLESLSTELRWAAANCTACV